MNQWTFARIKDTFEVLWERIKLDRAPASLWEWATIVVLVGVVIWAVAS